MMLYFFAQFIYIELKSVIPLENFQIFTDLLKDTVS
jgi:hypothetical protein